MYSSAWAGTRTIEVVLYSGNTIDPAKTYSFTATVTNQDGGAPSQPVPVSIKVEVDPTSGGHDHGETFATRPKGSVSPAFGSTLLTFTFAATPVSGTHTITAMCDLCENKTKTATVEVKVDVLEPIPDASFYTFIGDTVEHKKNHYLTPDAATNMLYIAASYRTEARFWKKLKGMKSIPRLPMRLNDASLIWGGLFDIKGKWKPGHQGHRRGVVIDVKANDDTGATGAIPLSTFDNFKKMALKYYGADAQIHCTSNKTDGQNRKQPTCVGKDGSQDPNRHFHILLLGDDQ